MWNIYQLDEIIKTVVINIDYLSRVYIYHVIYPWWAYEGNRYTHPTLDWTPSNNAQSWSKMSSTCEPYPL
jgi:hypothetical protein